LARRRIHQLSVYGLVFKFAADDGAVLLEQEYPDMAATMWITLDETDDSLYVMEITSYI